ncbi:MAG: tetratricopeptide repeat protein, partial [Gallionellaceae bacterium]|nr:tetratricopeptide repeat protein [Gallionellaceae bacterium]
MAHSERKTAALFKQVLAQQQAGDIAATIDLLEKLLRLNARHLDANYMLGTLYAERGDLQLAAKYLLSAMNIAPLSHLVHNNLGNVYRLQKNFERATQHYKRALQIQPNLPEAYFNMGNIHEILDRRNEAADCYLQAIQLDPQFTNAHFKLGKAYLAAEEYSDARQCFQNVLALNPQYAHIHFYLGVCYTRLNEREAALLHLNKHLQSNSDDKSEAQLYLAYLNAAPIPDHYPVEEMKNTYKKRAATWDSDIEQPNKEFLGPQLIQRALVKMLPHTAPLDILDIGCGTGLCGRFLRPLARRLDGVDLSEDMLQEAGKKQLYDHLICIDISEFMNQHPLDYDLIIGSGVLILIGDLRPVFQAAAEALRPGGQFIFTLYSSETEPVVVRENMHFAHSHTHIVERAAEAGLAVVSIEAVIHE